MTSVLHVVDSSGWIEVFTNAAQAELEQLVLITADSQLSAFPCRQLWEG